VPSSHALTSFTAPESLNFNPVPYDHDLDQNTTRVIRLEVFPSLLDKFLVVSWRCMIWTVNGFFLVMTVLLTQLSGSSSYSRHGLVQYLAAVYTCRREEFGDLLGRSCLILVSILAFERFLHANKTATYEKTVVVRLSALTAGLSLDELGSIHERSALRFSTWALSGNMSP
jgi:hypothetical protein